MNPRIKLGIENLLDRPPSWLKDKRIALLGNQASVDSGLRHSSHLISQVSHQNLKALFGPQHGMYAEKQDNMKESSHFIHPCLKIPVFSLYGETRVPTKEMLEEIDVLIIDLQDVGTRVYTFISTMAYCLKCAAQYQKKVVVLDRPNPIGGSILEGNLLKEGLRSFVGIYPLPMRHGLTIAELANFLNCSDKIACDLEVIPMKGWSRKMYFADTGLTWVPPSPNMPIPDTAIVYPGQVILEGTNISEGRGTTQPFETFGAPFINPLLLKKEIDMKKIKGVFLREIFFQPTFNKWQGELCGGLQIHITDRRDYRPYLTTLAIVESIISLYPNEFSWSDPPYEYEYERMPIDLILGDDDLRRDIEQLKGLDRIEASWQKGLIHFKKRAKDFYLYS